MKKQSIRIVSVDKRYTHNPYPFIPIYNERIGAFVTGQHIDPSDPKTKGNLTRIEMEDPSKMSDEKRKKFPFVILPEVRLPLTHHRVFDLTLSEDGQYVNEKDAAEFKFFQLQTDKIALSKDTVKHGTHYFYIENKEAEATKRTSSRKLRFEAETLVRTKGGIAKYRDIALLLNYKVREFRVNVDATETILEDNILDACEKFPAEVIKCFSEESDQDLFILRAEKAGIIIKKGESFMDGAQYLGDTLVDIKRFLNTEDGAHFEKRWQTQLGKAMNVPTTQVNDDSNEARFKYLIQECSVAIITKDYIKAETFYQEAFVIDPENDILPTIKEQIELLQNPAPGTTPEELMAVKRKELEEKYAGKSKQSLLGTCRQALKLDNDLFADKDEDQLRELIIETQLKEKE